MLCSVAAPDAGGLKTVFCLPDGEARGLFKLRPQKVKNVGAERLFPIPVINKGWDQMDFEGVCECVGEGDALFSAAVAQFFKFSVD